MEHNYYLYCIPAHMRSVQDVLSPFLKLVKSGDIATCRFTEYVQCYNEIILK